MVVSNTYSAFTYAFDILGVSQSVWNSNYVSEEIENSEIGYIAIFFMKRTLNIDSLFF